MLKLHTKATPNNLLQTDLTGRDTDWRAIKPYHGELVRLCREQNGIGIAANQLGLEENFFFVAANAKLRNGKAIAQICVKPHWEPDKKSELTDFKEGCLSLPGKEFIVQRHTRIRASWVNAVGHQISDVLLTGRGAQVFQHEHDHLLGVTLEQSGREV